jgi:hypothetical protein
MRERVAVFGGEIEFSGLPVKALLSWRGCRSHE